jgi:hypothetical protein
VHLLHTQVAAVDVLATPLTTTLAVLVVVAQVPILMLLFRPLTAPQTWVAVAVAAQATLPETVATAEKV